jgi:hypothetical protein
MSLLAQLVIALAFFVAGAAGGIKWHAGQDAIAARAADELRQADARQQRQFADKGAERHAAALRTLNNSLGNARAKIATLSGRSCLDAGTVRVLNDIGRDESMRAPAVDAAGAPAAAASNTDVRTATDVDVATAIATCRAGYAVVSDQVNKILDIEDKRHPPAP